MCVSERVILSYGKKKIAAKYFWFSFWVCTFYGETKHVYDFMLCCYVMGDISKGLNTISFSAWNSTVNILWSNILWELNTIIWITMAEFFHIILFVFLLLTKKYKHMKNTLYTYLCVYVCVYLIFKDSLPT